MPNAFLVMSADEKSPVIVHVPHSSRVIPHAVRTDLLCDDSDLAEELDEATDTGTDEITIAALAHTHTLPAVIINQLSRLVVDPERFPDDSEPSEEYGRGAVYTRTCSGNPLRREPHPRRTELLDTYFRPYAAALTDAVTDRLNTCGRAIIIDLHSYPEKPSAFEDPNSPRPALCIGADYRHTPDWLIDATRGSFASLGDIRENTPYAGCYVPLTHYGHDLRVSSVMIELRRDTYLTDPRTPDQPSVTALGKSLATLIDTATDRPADV